ncbi:CDP-glycerol glycerophosphotransferase family protein [Streptomyces sp. NPDC090025]|uniref:bifunctional glycosyltransferase/CDP-glycerol:glycerophosphate glycerophosphotransferase n=1 Tax=Streptomyces sp. NPDC090025 TaxID=3365922 RepID=UPI0038375898
MSPQLSIVVPFQNVEQYLTACLESLAAQSFEDFEAVLVDDGSTDGSARLAAEFCREDPRFRLVRQQAHGPGHARNTGLRAADPDAEFLAFADGDDLVPDHAYELLIGTLRETGSDFASGNVRMMNSHTSWASDLHHPVLRRDRRRTHITRKHDLIYDRTVWNKVFRRSFWDRHRISYPEGVLYEDIWVNLYAHHRAEAVDVVATPVYFWRRRDGGAAPSITQLNHSLTNVRDRFTAVREVSRFLGGQGAEYADHKRRYDRAVLGSDLMIHLKALPEADDECRALFMAQANAFVDEAAPDVIDGLRAADRVKWHLVRAGKLAELLDLVRWERDNRGPVPVRRRFRRHLDHPYLGDRSVGVPRDASRLREEFSMRGSLTSAVWEDGKLRLSGRAYIRNLDVSKRRHTVKAVALRNKKLSSRIMVQRARTTYAPEATEHSGQDRYSYDWSGFETVIDPRRLRHGGAWVEGTWDVAVGALSRGVFRYKSLIAGDACTASHPAPLQLDRNTRVVPLFVDGVLKLRVERVRCRVTGHALRGDHLELSGVLLADQVPASGTLRLRALSGVAEQQADVVFTPGGPGWCRFRTRVPVRPLGAGRPRRARTAGARATSPEGPGSPAATDTTDTTGTPGAPPVPAVPGTPGATDTSGIHGWKTTLHIPGRERPYYPVVAPETPDGCYPAPPAADGTPAEGSGREVVVHANAQGFLVLFERAEAPVADACHWAQDGTLTLVGAFPGLSRLSERQRAELRLVVRKRAGRQERTFPVRSVGGRFQVSLDPAHVTGPNGSAPLASGRWDLDLRVGRGAGLPPVDVPCRAHRRLIAEMPVRGTSDDRRYDVQTQWHDRLTLLAHSAMPVEGRGPYRQRLLRTRHYPAARRKPLREAVLFDSFRGTQLSDSPRAVFDELTRRGTGLELLWVVRDDQIQVPANARAVRMWSPEWYEALARSRHLVFNNHLPPWFRRREGQTVVQTWHGTPLKKIGHDIESPRFADRDYLERLPTEVGQWSMLVSPNRFSTPIMRRAFGFGGELLETGYPRNDVLYAPDRAERAAAVRRRLGLPDGKRVVLYAPTWRDHLHYGPGRYRFDFRIDLADARRRLGDDHVLLVRRHPNVVDPVPGAGDGFVRDVTDYSDIADLMLVTDVLVTDYSSLMFDFANTGRPMLFFTYDLGHYRDTLRGFYFDFEAAAPGPLLATSPELVDAIRDADGLRERYALPYRRFRRDFCGLDDGHAAGRVVDRMLGVPAHSPAALDRAA